MMTVEQRKRCAKALRAIERDLAKSGLDFAVEIDEQRVPSTRSAVRFYRIRVAVSIPYDRKPHPTACRQTAE